MSGGGKRKEYSQSEENSGGGQANHFRSLTFDCEDEEENNIYNHQKHQNHRVIKPDQGSITLLNDQYIDQKQGQSSIYSSHHLHSSS